VRPDADVQQFLLLDRREGRRHPAALAPVGPAIPVAVASPEATATARLAVILGSRHHAESLAGGPSCGDDDEDERAEELMEKVVAETNAVEARNAVIRNRGAAGIDRMTTVLPTSLISPSQSLFVTSARQVAM
jgi:predicted secreted protein